MNYLIKALADKAAEVRLAAVNSLAEMGDPASIDALKTLLDTETDPAVSRAAILNAISRIESAAARQNLRSEPVTLPKLVEPFYQEAERAAGRSQYDSVLASDLPTTGDNSNGRHFSNSVFHESVQSREARHQQQGLEEIYRREAEEREQLEKARRRSYDEASRRTEEILHALQADEESLTRLEESLTARRARLQGAQKNAIAEAARLDELEHRLAADEVNRQRLEEEKLRLLAETRARAESERSQLERLRLETAEQQERLTEHELSLERVGKLRAASEAYYQEQADLLTSELNSLRQAGQELSRLLTGAEAARQRADEEIDRLHEIHRRIEVEENARHAADNQRRALESEIKVRADEARRRLEEARHRDQESRRQIEKDARRHALEDSYRLSRLDALRKQCEEEAQQRAAEEEKLKTSIEAIREATQARLKAIAEAEALKQTETVAFQKAQEQAQNRLAEAVRRREEEDERLKAEEDFWAQTEEESRRRADEKRQSITVARQRAEEAARRLEQLEEEARVQGVQVEMLATESRQRIEEQSKRISALESMRQQAEAEALALIAKEQEILAGIETFRQTSAKLRQKLEEQEAERAEACKESLALELEQVTSAESLRL
jgi:hypothetical protein